MSDPKSPKIADTIPDMRDLAPGTYHWCACGESKNQPFCDGSHKSTAFQPVPFTLTQQKRCKLCLCKRTKVAPYCDGAHNDL